MRDEEDKPTTELSVVLIPSPLPLIPNLYSHSMVEGGFEEMS